jgi:hypothetical protein
MKYLVHYLDESENVRCGKSLPEDFDLISGTTSDWFQITCPKCGWLVINDAKPKALQQDESLYKDGN